MGDIHIPVPLALWESCRSDTTRTNLRSSLLRLDTNQLSGIGLLIKQRLEAIFNFIDDIARVDTPAELEKKNLFLIYSNAHRIRDLLQVLPESKPDLFPTELIQIISNLNEFIDRCINPHLDKLSPEARAQLGSSNLIYSSQTGYASPAFSIWKFKQPNSLVTTWDTHIGCIVQPDANDRERKIASLQAKKSQLTALDPDMRGIINSFLMSHFEAFSPRPPSEFFIKIHCGKNQEARVEFTLSNGNPIPELESVKDTLNQDLNSLIQERLIPIFEPNTSLLDDVFYSVKIHKVKVLHIPPSPSDN